MDEATERKARDLKLKILKVEKELAASQHTANLGAWLRAGNANQIHKNAERDRERLETKLEELKSKLEEVAPDSTASTAEKPKRTAAKKAAEKSTATTTKKAAGKKSAAKKTGSKTAR